MTENIIQLHNLNPEELKELIATGVRDELNKVTQNSNAALSDEYITRKEAANILKVTEITLFNWEKKGIITPYRIGNLIRYKRLEIEAALHKNTRKPNF